MDNVIIDQKIQIQNLEEENKALKSKIELMYKNWNFDNQKYQYLKEKYYAILTPLNENCHVVDEPTVINISGDIV